ARGHDQLPAAHHGLPRVPGERPRTHRLRPARRRPPRPRPHRPDRAGEPAGRGHRVHPTDRPGRGRGPRPRPRRPLRAATLAAEWTTADAWVFAAIEGTGCTLLQIIMKGDGINHAVLTE